MSTSRVSLCKSSYQLPVASCQSPVASRQLPVVHDQISSSDCSHNSGADAFVREGNDAQQAVLILENAAQAHDSPREPEWSRGAF
jgi:hypothetical protein